MSAAHSRTGPQVFLLAVAGTVVAGTAVAVAGACATAEERRATRGPVSVEVTNHNPLDVNVYAVSGSQTIRLGMVTTNGTSTFEVPVGLSPARGLRLLVDPIGARAGFLTDEVVPIPGDVVQLVIESNLSLSSTSVH